MEKKCKGYTLNLKLEVSTDPFLKLSWLKFMWVLHVHTHKPQWRVNHIFFSTISWDKSIEFPCPFLSWEKIKRTWVILASPKNWWHQVPIYGALESLAYKCFLVYTLKMNVCVHTQSYIYVRWSAWLNARNINTFLFWFWRMDHFAYYLCWARFMNPSIHPRKINWIVHSHEKNLAQFILLSLSYSVAHLSDGIKALYNSKRFPLLKLY